MKLYGLQRINCSLAPRRVLYGMQAHLPQHKSARYICSIQLRSHDFFQTVPKRSIHRIRTFLQPGSKLYKFTNKTLATPHRTNYSTMPVYKVNASTLAQRPAARVLVINDEGKVLLLEYRHEDSNDALSNKGSYFTTPGGRREPDESFIECAQRELYEETGIEAVVDPRVIATRTAPLMTSRSGIVLAVEEYFAVWVNKDLVLDNSNFTEKEKCNVKQYHWCDSSDLANLRDKHLWPSILDEILTAAKNVAHNVSEPDSSTLGSLTNINKNHTNGDSTVDARTDSSYKIPLKYASTKEALGDIIVEVEY